MNAPTFADPDFDPARVRGLGGAAPVAANDSEIGRQRNRRVEVWVY